MRVVTTRAALGVLAAAVMVLGGCSDDGDGASAGADGVLADLAPTVEDLTVDGDGPTLSWQPVEGAVRYAVTVGDGEGLVWSWEGEETEVELGTLPPLTDGAAEPLDASLDLRIPIEPGGDHRWFVIAFDADDEILAISEEHPLTG